jgi:hypothetical protein
MLFDVPHIPNVYDVPICLFGTSNSIQKYVAIYIRMFFDVPNIPNI